MSDTEIKSEPLSMCMMSVVRSATCPPKTPPLFPPSHFAGTIQDKRLGSCPSSCFVIYALNFAQLKFDPVQSCDFPFELFKDCYRKSESRFDLSKYFEVCNLDVPLDQDITWEGTTIGESSKEEVFVLPPILRFHTATANLNTERHLQSHASKLETVLERFNARQLPNLYINWLKLVESYVEIVFRDLLVKWCQWLHSVRTTGHRRSVQTVLRTWLNRLCKRLWSRYFVFEHAAKSSVDDMGRKLAELASASQLNFEGASSSHGIWLDSKNGILLFGSGLPFQEVRVCPMYGVCLDQSPAEVTTRKLLLFVNVAILECFVNEIS